MTGKSAFLTDGWIKALEEETQKLLDAKPDAAIASFAYVERFTDPPSPRSDGKLDGYRMDIANGKVTVRSGVSADESADCYVTIDHGAAFATLPLKSGPAMDEVARQAFEKGQIEIAGSFDGIPIDLGAVHDAMVDRTLLD